MAAREETSAEPVPALVLVTGLSGAGKSTALKALEDLGYDAIDNPPLALLAPLLQSTAADARLAIGIDSRTRAFSPANVLAAVAAEAARGRAIEILYLECSDVELIRRFSETRRRHPLAPDRPVTDGIALERELLADLQRAATMMIDTTSFRGNDLGRAIAARFGQEGQRRLTVAVMSFGYARGVPRDADLMFDMRFLRNPHWVPELRQKTGLADDVRAYVAADPCYRSVRDHILALLLELLPRYVLENRSYLTIAFGCTGGKHRSVVITEEIGAMLQERGWPNAIIHRDCDAGPAASPHPAAPHQGKEGRR